MLELLLKLGLSQKEAQVYLATLELGEDTVQNVAKKAQVNRATTYVILEQLMKLGLVSSIERTKKRLFIAEDPTELENLLEKQKQEIENKKRQLQENMTQFKAVYNRQGNKPIVRYFEGGDGLEALDRYGRDQFKPGSESVGIAPIDLIEEYFPQRRKAAVKHRLQHKIKSRIIYTHKDGKIPTSVNKEQMREAIFLPRSLFPIDITIQIYTEWGVKFFNFNKNNFFGVLIQSPDVARNMMRLFELAWEGAKLHQKK